MSDYQKTGYLNSNFKIFHLIDNEQMQFDFHYHDFHKILIHLHGNTSYCIEGRTYQLQPNDIVFVNAGEVHRPDLQDNSTYERIIIYISQNYLNDYNKKNNDLSLCFKQASLKESHVLRIPSFSNSKLTNITRELENSLDDNEYANELYHEILFLEFMIQLNRAAIHNGIEYIAMTSSDSKILSIIEYLNQNLTNDISIDLIADKFYISRYHLMHTFKKETGYTIGNYINLKRLQFAQTLIDNGELVNTACYSSGFKNYSTFLRSYKKQFGHTPKKHDNSSVLPMY